MLRRPFLRFSTGMICGIAAAHAALVWTDRLPGWSPRNLLPAMVADLGVGGMVACVMVAGLVVICLHHRKA